MLISYLGKANDVKKTRYLFEEIVYGTCYKKYAIKLYALGSFVSDIRYPYMYNIYKVHKVFYPKASLCIMFLLNHIKCNRISPLKDLFPHPSTTYNFL